MFAFSSVADPYLWSERARVSAEQLAAIEFFLCGFCGAEAPAGNHVCGDRFSRQAMRRLEPSEQHPGSRDFTDDDESCPPHFTDETSHEPEDEEGE